MILNAFSWSSYFLGNSFFCRPLSLMTTFCGFSFLLRVWDFCRWSRCYIIKLISMNKWSSSFITKSITLFLRIRETHSQPWNSMSCSFIFLSWMSLIYYKILGLMRSKVEENEPYWIATISWSLQDPLTRFLMSSLSDTTLSRNLFIPFL